MHQHLAVKPMILIYGFRCRTIVFPKVFRDIPSYSIPLHWELLLLRPKQMDGIMNRFPYRIGVAWHPGYPAPDY